ncbi:MAG: methyl-accepting chemotaxis protein, partial [Candidatus Caldarchaeum sp.]
MRLSLRVYGVGLLVFVSLMALLPVVFVSYRSNAVLVEEITRQMYLSSLEGAINVLKGYVAREYGDLRLSGDVLVDGSSRPLANRFEAVDEVSRQMGVVATIFQRSGDDFVRVSTSVRKDDGSRAVGTTLGKESAAYRPLMEGKRYVGEAKILGKPYATVYEPLLDQRGEVIGVFFAGVPAEKVQEMVALGKSRFFRNVFLVFLFVFLLASLAGFLFVNLLVVKPIEGLMAVLGRLREGDLTFDLSEGSCSREFDFLCQALGSVRANLGAMISSIVSEADRISHSSQSLAVSSHQMSAISQEVSARMEEVSRSIGDLAASTGRISTGVQEIALSAQNVSHAALHLSEGAVEITSSVGKGEEALKETAKAIEQARERVKQTVEVAADLSRKANGVSSILDTITSIADQTNLLALNAAIEAARAGEAGRGFAVVAEEVRKLAEESKGAADQIAHILEQMGEGVARVDLSTRDVLKAVEDIQDRSEVAISKFREISELIKRMSDEINTLAASAQEQGAATQEMGRSVEIIATTAASIAEQVSAVLESVKEQARASQSLSEMSRSLSSVATSLNLYAGRLKVHREEEGKRACSPADL